MGEHDINDPQKLVGSRKDRFFERKPILGSFLVIVSETVIELDDPDGHEPEHPPEMTVGILISMEEPPGPMKTEAVTAGFYESTLWGKKYPKVQLFTVAELLAGKKIEMPPVRQVEATFKKAPKVTQKKREQHELDV